MIRSLVDGGHRVLVRDQAGFGRSDKPTASFVAISYWCLEMVWNAFDDETRPPTMPARWLNAPTLAFYGFGHASQRCFHCFAVAGIAVLDSRDGGTSAFNIVGP